MNENETPPASYESQINLTISFGIKFRIASLSSLQGAGLAVSCASLYENFRSNLFRPVDLRFVSDDAKQGGETAAMAILFFHP